MNIKRYIGGSLESNGYIISAKPGGTCYVIDPGYEPQRFIDHIEKEGLQMKGIILTHLHSDHVGGADKIADHFDCPVMMHGEDAAYYKGRVDQILSDGDAIDMDGEELKIIWTPGHTRGSVCIMSEKSRVCFTGDTIFDTDLGRTDLAGGSEDDMRNSICSIIDGWENDIFIFPGHDNGCSMKQVREWNTEFNALLRGEDR